MTTNRNVHEGQAAATVGKPLAEATAAMILVHGRGATAVSILDLASVLPHPTMAYLAPQATGHSWYPLSFLAPMDNNQPGLDSGLATIGKLVQQIEEAGIPASQIVLGGFSQGACLASEFVARNARRYGGLLVFSGGLIGPPGTPRTYDGTLDGTPVFIGCSDVDFHIPLTRVQETTAVFQQMGGNVTEKIYPQMGHTIVQDEIKEAQKILAKIR